MLLCKSQENTMNFKIFVICFAFSLSLTALAEVDEAKFNKQENYPSHPTDAITLTEKYRVGTMTGKGVKKLEKLDIWLSPSRNPQPEKLVDYNFPLFRNPDSIVKRSPITAFALLKDNKLVYEKYQYSSNNLSLFDSQSMAKTFTALAIGAALDKGDIKNIDEPLSASIPEISNLPIGKSSIRQALNMTCGNQFKFSDDVSGEAANYLRLKFYKNSSHNNFFDYLNSLSYIEPGGKFNYDPHCSDLLSIVIKRKTGKNLKDYFQDNIWQKINTSSQAAWLGTRIQPSFTSGANSFFATLHDYIKIAKLLINNCRFNDQQIISLQFCNEMISSSVSIGNYPSQFKRYGYQTWIKNDESDSWFAPLGALGQRMYIDRNNNSAMIVFALDYSHISETDKFWEWFRTHKQ